MSMQDTIADMLTRIRNAHMSKHESVSMQSSKIKLAIAKVLKAEGYIQDFKADTSTKPILQLTLKYHQGQAVIEKIRRKSRPGLRAYFGADEMPQIKGGLGIAIVSTPKGVMTATQAKKLRVGGEILCTVE
jgi:small subunit ribosomal protein S8